MNISSRLALSTCISAILVLIGGRVDYVKSGQALAFATSSATASLSSTTPITMSNIQQVRLITRLGRGTVRQVLWAPDGKTLAVASSIGISLYAADNFGAQPRLLAFYQSTISSFAFRPDGKQIAFSSTLGLVHIWDIATGQSVSTIEGLYRGIVSDIAFNSSGNLLAISNLFGLGTVSIWDTQANRALHHLSRTDTRAAIYSVAFSPVKDVLAVGSIGGDILLWDAFAGTLQHKMVGHRDIVYAVAFSPDGNTLASGSAGSNDNSVRLWDTATGKQTSLLVDKTNTGALTFSPDGQTLAIGTLFSGLQFWALSSGQKLPTASANEGEIRSLSYNPKGTQIAFTSAHGVVQVMDTATHQTKATLGGFTDYIYSVAFNGDGTLLASGDMKNDTRIWSSANGKLLKLLLAGHTGFVLGVAFSPDSRILASAGLDGSIRLWDVESGVLQKQLNGNMGWVTALAFSPDGKILASAGNEGSAGLWSIPAGRLLTRLNHSGAWVSDVAFSPDGKWLASADGDGILRIWTAFGRPHFKLHTEGDDVKSLDAVAFSPNSKQVATVGDNGTLRLWNVLKGSIVSVIHSPGNESLEGVVFSPDGQLLVTGSYLGIRIWDVATGRLLITLREGTEKYTAIAFSPNGRVIVGGCDDGTLRVWGVN